VTVEISAYYLSVLVGALTSGQNSAAFQRFVQSEDSILYGTATASPGNKKTTMVKLCMEVNCIIVEKLPNKLTSRHHDLDAIPLN